MAGSCSHDVTPFFKSAKAVFKKLATMAHPFEWSTELGPITQIHRLPSLPEMLGGGRNDVLW
jgi:hypothetical protein